MNNDLISREALREDLRRFFPTEVLEGIDPKTLFAQIMHDIDNAPTVEVDEMTQGIPLNDAINIIKETCKNYKTCVECPMNFNCNEHPAEWKEAKGDDNG